ncbi:hypothetical protein NC651_011061 [Populus alba x Populus x berolinensis]|nr:hypothetical protein NC651_011061 [Populus alba x Populus x berolinensis]
MHADSLDWFLMILGLFGSIGEGFSTPLVFLVASKLKNNLAGSYSVTDAFSDNISRTHWRFVTWLVCFIGWFSYRDIVGQEQVKDKLPECNQDI